MPIRVVALLYPKKDRVARVEEITKEVVNHVKENEPGVLQYEWFRAVAEEPTIVVLETYADQAAIDNHKASPKMAWLVETEKKEGNMAKPIQIIPLEQYAGWASRL
ncbi:hypothetical protein OQA88_5579 [Cercophora sp. LCS_1]